MKLLRYGPVGQEKPGVLDAEGGIRDLSGIITDIAGDSLSPASLDRLKSMDPAALPKVSGNPRIGPCVGHVPNFIAIGLNFSDHAAEVGAAPPPEPIVFNKHTSCINGPNDDVVLPKGAVKTDWEVELAMVVGTRCSNVSEEDSLSHIAGFCIVNDVSERAFQMERGGQWMKGKSADTFGPLGPWLVTPDEIPDLSTLDMFLDVNGTRMQTGNTKTMIFGCAVIVSYVSRFMTLVPGDVITTGTPPGVGVGMKPQQFLKPGDMMHLGITGLGEQRQRVVAYGE